MVPKISNDYQPESGDMYGRRGYMVVSENGKSYDIITHQMVVLVRKEHSDKPSILWVLRAILKV